MNRILKGLGVTIASLVVACKGDPTAGLEGTGPRYVTASIGYHTMGIGDSVRVTSQARDAGNNPLADTAVAASSDPTIATVSDVAASPLPQKGIYIKAVAPGATTIVLTAGTAVDSIHIVVFPSVFDGSVTLVKTAQLDTIVIASSTQITFDSAKVSVAVGGVKAHIVSTSPTQVKALLLNKAAAAADSVVVSNLVFLGSYPLKSLSPAATVSIRGDATEPNNSTATATALTLSGTSFTIVDGVFDGTADVDDFYKITLTAATTITAEADFDGAGVDPDIDLYILDATGVASACNLDNCTGATGSQPQTATTITVPAGTYYVYVNFFDKGAASAPFWYRLKVKKNS